ncbi:T6SS immunity protein Tli4 family protein [Trinickia sp. LjRoot230]|uniref:T6SS immunity protein Tli4 family protein n=1 Tax=Trinickia sp. LjRoot230 TaxID=3342288 RepID=UPI003ECE0721
MTEQEQSTLNVLTTNLKTQCVGRYLVDVPADSAIFGTSEVNGVTIESQAMSLGEYRKAMDAHSVRLKNTESRFGYRFLYVDSEIEGIPESRYFLSLGNPEALTDSERLIEGYRWDRGYRIKMQITASDARNSTYFKDDEDARNSEAMNNVAKKAQRVIALLSSARARPDDEIPTEPGMCFQGGFLAGKPWEHEQAFGQFVMPSHSDTSVGLRTYSNVKEKTSLLERAEEVDKEIKGAQGRTIRKGPVSLAGTHAEEWLMSGITVLRVKGFHFYLEGNSKIGSPETPLIALNMEVGAPNRVFKEATLERVTLTELEAVGLWNAVSRTLRPRPGGF